MPGKLTSQFFRDAVRGYTPKERPTSQSNAAATTTAHEPAPADLGTVPGISANDKPSSSAEGGVPSGDPPAKRQRCAPALQSEQLRRRQHVLSYEELLAPLPSASAPLATLATRTATASGAHVDGASGSGLDDSGSQHRATDPTGYPDPSPSGSSAAHAGCWLQGVIAAVECNADDAARLTVALESSRTWGHLEAEQAAPMLRRYLALRNEYGLSNLVKCLAKAPTIATMPASTLETRFSDLKAHLGLTAAQVGALCARYPYILTAKQSVGDALQGLSTATGMTPQIVAALVCRQPDLLAASTTKIAANVATLMEVLGVEGMQHMSNPTPNPTPNSTASVATLSLASTPSAQGGSSPVGGPLGNGPDVTLLVHPPVTAERPDNCDEASARYSPPVEVTAAPEGTETVCPGGGMSAPAEPRAAGDLPCLLPLAVLPCSGTSSSSAAAAAAAVVATEETAAATTVEIAAAGATAVGEAVAAAAACEPNLAGTLAPQATQAHVSGSEPEAIVGAITTPASERAGSGSRSGSQTEGGRPSDSVAAVSESETATPLLGPNVSLAPTETTPHEADVILDTSPSGSGTQRGPSNVLAATSQLPARSLPARVCQALQLNASVLLGNPQSVAERWRCLFALLRARPHWSRELDSMKALKLSKLLRAGANSLLRLRFLHETSDVTSNYSAVTLVCMASNTFNERFPGFTAWWTAQKATGVGASQGGDCTPAVHAAGRLHVPMTTAGLGNAVKNAHVQLQRRRRATPSCAALTGAGHMAQSHSSGTHHSSDEDDAELSGDMEESMDD